MGLRDDERAGIGDARAAGVRQEPEVMAGARGSEQLRAALRRGLVAELHDVDLPDRKSGASDCRKARAGLAFSTM